MTAPVVWGQHGTAPAQVDAVSLVRLTYQHNLEVTAARYDVKASEFQFRRFERNLSQFRPFTFETGIDRTAQTVRTTNGRSTEYDAEGRVAMGLAKEFFDGTNLEANVGVRQLWDEDGRNQNPYVELEARFPLFSSFTRLERVTERSFEESEMLGSWLDFIETVEETIADSAEAYFDLQFLLALRALTAAAHDDLDTLLAEPVVAARGREANLLRDQMQAYQSRVVELDGAITAAHIRLADRLGLDDLPPSAITTMDFHASSFYGGDYLNASVESLIARAVENDVELRVMEIARDNARLKRRLAERGEWEIVGRVAGAYDFESRGDDPRERSGYRAAVAVSVERNDPRLLQLSLWRADAEERKFEASIAFRGRQLRNEISRGTGRASSLRDVVRELEASRDLRLTVFSEKRASYLANSTETLDNVIQARSQLFGTERDLLASLREFFEIVIDLDVATGAYFARLEGLMERFEDIRGNASTGDLRFPAGPESPPPSG